MNRPSPNFNSARDIAASENWLVVGVVFTLDARKGREGGVMREPRTLVEKTLRRLMNIPRGAKVIDPIADRSEFLRLQGLLHKDRGFDFVPGWFPPILEEDHLRSEPDENQLRPDAKEFIYTLWPDLDVPARMHDIRLIADEAARIFAQAVETGTLECLTSRQLEKLLAECFRRAGYETCLTPATRDGGRDVIAALPGHLPYLIVAEAKRQQLVEPAVVHSLVGVRDRDNAHMALIATTGRFSENTKTEVFQKWKRLVQLKDGEQFLAWIRELQKAGQH